MLRFFGGFPIQLRRFAGLARTRGLRRRAAALIGGAAVISSAALLAAGWPQWGGGPEHTGASATAAQPVASILADVVVDPFVAAESAESGGDLLAHYAVPLLGETDVYMEFKSGEYRSCVPPGSGEPAPCGPSAWNTQQWGVRRLAWRNGSLATVWSFASDWKPEPPGGTLSIWEPVFHPVLAGGFVYVPGFGGTVWKLSKQTGAVISRVNPFGVLDPKIYVAGGLAADAGGNVYYDAIQLDPDDPWGGDALGGWLVKVLPDDSAARAAFGGLVPGAPGPNDRCESTFSIDDLPWPPSPEAIAPTVRCGSQRPGVNVVPAIAPDGTVYTVSRAHRNASYAYLVATRSDLTPLWAASLRGRLADGCDVLLPPNGSPGGCRSGAVRGVDPATNTLPAGVVLDAGTSSPVVLPDGSVLYGAYTRYNWSRGHLFKFGPRGEFLAAYDFGWDITPAVFPRSGTYSVILKDNHYDVGSYCGDPKLCPRETAAYDLVSLDANLSVQWRYRNVNTLSCARLSDGSLSCVSDHPDGFEWCVNQPAVDGGGVVYANSEDGFLYAVGPDGALLRRIFLNLAIGAAYTPVSIGPNGIVYAQNDGHLFAIGNPQRPVVPPALPHRPPVPHPFR